MSTNTCIKERRRNEGKDQKLFLNAAIVEKYKEEDEKKRLDSQHRSIERMSYRAVLPLISSCVYLAYRIKCTWDAQSKVAAYGAVVAWAYMAVEIGTAFPTLLFLALLSFAAGKGQPRNLLRLRGDQVPTVDVFIPCCGEMINLILDTVKAACTVDYPNNRFRVVVLDDGSSAKLEKEISQVQRGQSNLYYTARPNKSTGFEKASNLNYGLNYVKALPGGPSEYVAVLDADMIAEPDWLRALLPHLLQEPGLGLANPPQEYYNLPPNDPLLQSLDGLFDIVEPVKDRLGAAWCTGSGWIARRCAIDEMGGIPADLLNEDILTSLLLLAAGWRIAYVPEKLQHGLAPDSVQAHISQRKRWTVGVMQLINFGWSPRARTMTLHQRFGAVVPAINFASSIIVVTVAATMMPLTLLSGRPLIVYSTPQQLRLLCRLAFVDFAANWFASWQTPRARGLRRSAKGSLAAGWLLPYQLVMIVRFFILSPLLGRLAPANFTASGSSPRIKQPSVSGAPITQRLKILLWDCQAWIHVIFVTLCILGLVASCRAAFPISLGRSSAQDILKQILVYAGWPPALAICCECIAQCWIPVSHALFPTPALAREDLLVRDPTSRVAYPSQEAKEPEWKIKQGTKLHVMMVNAYYIMAFVGSWYL